MYVGWRRVYFKSCVAFSLSVCHYLKSYLLSRTLTKEQISLSMRAAVLFLRVRACCNFGSEGGNFERKRTAL